MVMDIQWRCQQGSKMSATDFGIETPSKQRQFLIWVLPDAPETLAALNNLHVQ